MVTSYEGTSPAANLRKVLGFQTLAWRRPGSAPTTKPMASWFICVD